MKQKAKNTQFNSLTEIFRKEDFAMITQNDYEKLCAARRKLIKREDIVLVSTENEKVLGEEFIDGHIEITVEWRRINETQCEYISHRNVDANGNFYTKRDIVKRTKPLTIERVTL